MTKRFVWVGEIGDVRYDAMETRWVDGWCVRGACSKRYLCRVLSLLLYLPF